MPGASIHMQQGIDGQRLAATSCQYGAALDGDVRWAGVTYPLAPATREPAVVSDAQAAGWFSERNRRHH